MNLQINPRSEKLNAAFKKIEFLKGQRVTHVNAYTIKIGEHEIPERLLSIQGTRTLAYRSGLKYKLTAHVEDGVIVDFYCKNLKDTASKRVASLLQWIGVTR